MHGFLTGCADVVVVVVASGRLLAPVGPMLMSDLSTIGGSVEKRTCLEVRRRVVPSSRRT